MLRKIVDNKKIDKRILALLSEIFPDGYSDNDIIKFHNHNHDYIEAVELKSDDTMYLVKISSHLANILSKELYDD